MGYPPFLFVKNGGIITATQKQRKGVLNVTDQALVELAFTMLECSYVPYSRFPVGAALEVADTLEDTDRGDGGFGSTGR